jgi:hypothetical protein
MRSSHVDHPVGKELEEGKRWLICVYLRGREVREVERKKASPHRAVSGRREGRYVVRILFPSPDNCTFPITNIEADTDV